MDVNEGERLRGEEEGSKKKWDQSEAKKEDKDKEGGRVKERMQGNKGCKEGRQSEK